MTASTLVWRRAALVVVLLLVVVGCDAEVERTHRVIGVVGAKDVAVTVWLGPSPTLHPHQASAHLTSALYSPLVSSDPVSRLPSWGDDAPGAMLAEITTTDLRRWELVLKDGWRWHDGSAVVAADLERGWQHAVAAGLPLASTLADVRAVDDVTLAIALTAPFGPFPHLLVHPTFLPLPPIATTSPSQFAAAPLGTGPYRVSGRGGGGAYELEAVAGHPLAGRVDLGSLRVMLSARPDRSVDVVVGSDGLALPAAADDGSRSQVLHLPGRQLAYLAVPLTDPRFADPDVRRALSLALDREALVREVLGDTVVPADRLVGPGLARSATATCDACRHDPAEAASLWPEDFAEPLTIWFAAGAGHEPVIDAVAEAWTQVLGVDNLQLATLPAAELLDRLAEDQVSGPFRLTWQADVSSPARLVEPLFGPRGSANDGRYRGEEAAALLAAAGGTADLVAGLDAYGAAEQAVLDDLPLIPLWFSTVTVAASPEIQGILLDGEGRLDWTALRR